MTLARLGLAAALLVLFVAGCEGGTGPETGPSFVGKVWATDALDYGTPGIAGAEVRGTAHGGSCAAEPVIASESTTSDSAGEFQLMLPMESGTTACLRFEAWKGGARVAWAEVVGYRYEKSEPRYEGVNLTPQGRVTILRPSP